MTLALGSATLTYQVTIDLPPSANVGDVLTNNADLTWTSLPGPDAGERTGAGGVNDYRDGHQRKPDGDRHRSGPDQGRWRRLDLPGAVLAYTLTYQNVGNTAATGVLITDVVPDYTTFNPGGSTPGWSCVPDNNEGSTCTLTLAAPVVAGAPPVDVTFAVTVDASVPALVTLLENMALIHDDGANGIEPTPANNTDTETTPLQAAPDLTITKDDGVDIVSPGSLLVYAINYANVGNQDATGVEIRETVPAETTLWLLPVCPPCGRAWMARPAARSVR